jgi:hypothetical protein
MASFTRSVSWDTDWQEARERLASLNPTLAQAALAAAIPQKIDTALLAALLEIPQAEAVKLRRQLHTTGMMSSTEGAAPDLPPEIRRGLLTELQTQPDLFTRYHNTARAWFDRSPATESRIAALYHRIAADPATPPDFLRAEAEALRIAQDHFGLRALFAAMSELGGFGGGIIPRRADRHAGHAAAPPANPVSVHGGGLWDVPAGGCGSGDGAGG